MDDGLVDGLMDVTYLHPPSCIGMRVDVRTMDGSTQSAALICCDSRKPSDPFHRIHGTAGSTLFQRLSSFLAGVGVTSLIGFYFLYQDVKRCVPAFHGFDRSTD